MQTTEELSSNQEEKKLIKKNTIHKIDFEELEKGMDNSDNQTITSSSIVSIIGGTG